MVDTAPSPLEGSEAPPRRVAPFIVLAIAVVMGVLFVVLAGSEPATDRETASTHLIGRPAPPISGPTLAGDPFDLAGLRGEWVVLNFFQSICVPCVNEHPELLAFAEQQSALSDGARLVTVVFDDDDERVAEFFATEGGDWPVVLDRGGQVPFDYGVTRVPETWVIDPAGRVQVHYMGEITAAALSARVQELRDLAAGAAAG